MRNICICLSLSLMLTSCATLLNDSHTVINVYTDEPIAIIYKSDTIKSEPDNDFHSATLNVKRSRKSIEFAVRNDSLEKRIVESAIISPTIWINGLFIPTWPGAIVDLLSNNGHKYPNHIHLNNKLQKKQSNTWFEKFNLSQRAYKSKLNYSKGDVFFNLSVPPFQFGSVVLKPESERRFEEGTTLGFGVGIDYYYKNNEFINLTTNVAYAGRIFRWPYDYSGSEQSARVHNIQLSRNHRNGRFIYGYGISYSRTKWEMEQYTERFHAAPIRPNGEWEYPLTSTEFVRHEKYYSSLGAVASGHLQLWKSFYIGLVYRPQFIRLKSEHNKPFFYESQVTFDMAFRFKLGNVGSFK